MNKQVNRLSNFQSISKDSVMSTSYPKLSRILDAYRILSDLGDYDTSIAGAVAEIYAEEVCSMVKAARGQAGHDGVIGTRRVSVKGKESDRPGRYVALTEPQRANADDILIVVLCDDGRIVHYGPFPIDQFQDVFDATDRLPIKKIEERGIMPIDCGVLWK